MQKVIAIVAAAVAVSIHGCACDDPLFANPLPKAELRLDTQSTPPLTRIEASTATIVNHAATPFQFTLHNTGGGTLEVESIALGVGEGCASIGLGFSTQGFDVHTLGAGEHAAIDVGYFSRATGPGCAVLTVKTNDTLHPALQALLVVDVGADADVPDLCVSPRTLHFGTRTLAAQEDVTLSNCGNVPVTIDGVTVSAPSDFAVGGDDVTAVTLAPAESRTLQVRFTPVVDHTSSATITVYSSDPAEPAIVVTTDGNGAAVVDPQTFPPGTERVHFYEASAGIFDRSFLPTDAAFLTRLNDPLANGNCDFVGVPGECYDVFASDAEGNVDPAGSFLTIEATFGTTAPMGGGLNIAEVVADLDDGTTRHASQVTHFQVQGDNALPTSIANAVDGNTATCTTLGNTNGTVSRMSITVAF